MKQVSKKNRHRFSYAVNSYAQAQPENEPFHDYEKWKQHPQQQFSFRFVVILYFSQAFRDHKLQSIQSTDAGISIKETLDCN